MTLVELQSNRAVLGYEAFLRRVAIGLVGVLVSGRGNDSLELSGLVLQLVQPTGDPKGARVNVTLPHHKPAAVLLPVLPPAALQMSRLLAQHGCVRVAAAEGGLEVAGAVCVEEGRQAVLEGDFGVAQDVTLD